MVKPACGLLRGDQRTQRATRLFEDWSVTNMWEIAEAFKMECGVGRRASVRLRLGSDPSRGLRMTIYAGADMSMDF